ncbi:MAG: proline racemase family protein, partial [Planctomycetaceae bacterium]|nr:proline racemase family protein [Planctomycetaceae bacterium]
NWFFCVTQSPEEQLTATNTNRLIHISLKIRNALIDQNITGKDGAYIDHVELYGPALNPPNNSRNFVLCPGGSYDRSPCGTGTSAKLACLAADGKLAPGQVWRQESIVGSLMECSFEWADNKKQIIPTICGTAYLSAESTLLFDPADPFAVGIPNSIAR